MRDVRKDSTSSIASKGPGEELKSRRFATVKAKIRGGDEWLRRGPKRCDMREGGCFSFSANDRPGRLLFQMVRKFQSEAHESVDRTLNA